MTTKRDLLNHNFAENEVDFENADLSSLSKEYHSAMQSAGYEFTSARVSRRGRTLGFHVSVTPREWAVRQSEDFEANNAGKAPVSPIEHPMVQSPLFVASADEIARRKARLLQLLDDLLNESRV